MIELISLGGILGFFLLLFFAAVYEAQQAQDHGRQAVRLARQADKYAAKAQQAQQAGRIAESRTYQQLAVETHHKALFEARLSR